MHWIEDYLELVPPSNDWRVNDVREDGFHYVNPPESVIISGTIRDGKKWVHLSYSRKDRYPTWPELLRIRDCFIGPDKVCIQKVPNSIRRRDDIFDLHIWYCIDEDVSFWI